MLLDLFSNPMDTLLSLFISLPGVLLALSAHEAAHGWVANRCGDPTARLMGRISLNPLRHLDPVGFLCMLFAGFGWAKPVPVNPMNYRNYRKDDLRVSLAGITANLCLFLIAFILAAALITGAVSAVPGFESREAYIDHLESNHLIDENGIARENITAAWQNDGETMLAVIPKGETAVLTNGYAKTVYYTCTPEMIYEDSSLSMGFFLISNLWGKAAEILFQMLYSFIILNLGLAAFNLIPLPPLDGYHVLNDLVLKRPLFADIQAQRTGNAILIGLILIGNVYPRFDVVSIAINFVRNTIMSGMTIVWNSVLSLINII